MNFRTLLIIAQILGIWGASFFSAVEIESILASGPILSLSGAWIAWLAYRRQAVTAFYFGMLAPSFAWFCFLLIYTQRWGPSEAARPISALLTWLSLIVIPFGCLAALDIKNRSLRRNRGRVQFRISTMFWATGGVAALLGALRAFQVPAIVGLATLVLATIAGVLAYRLHGQRSEAASPWWPELPSDDKQPT